MTKPMKITLSTFAFLLFTISSFGQITPSELSCFDLKIKKFDHTYALMAGSSDTHIGVNFKVKNIGEVNYYSSNTGTLKLYSLLGEFRILLKSWTLSDIKAGKFKTFSWGKNYPSGMALPYKYEAEITLERPFIDCDKSNNSRTEVR